MKIKCRRCGIVLSASNMDFHDVERYSSLKCGDKTHEFIGVLE
jgi:hypothetical protein